MYRSLPIPSSAPVTSAARSVLQHFIWTGPFPSLYLYTSKQPLPSSSLLHRQPSNYRPFPLYAGWLERAPPHVRLVGKPTLPRGKIVGVAHRVVSQQRGLGVLTLSWSPSSVLRGPESDQPRRRDETRPPLDRRLIDVRFFPTTYETRQQTR